MQYLTGVFSFQLLSGRKFLFGRRAGNKPGALRGYEATLAYFDVFPRGGWRSYFHPYDMLILYILLYVYNNIYKIKVTPHLPVAPSNSLNVAS